MTLAIQESDQEEIGIRSIQKELITPRRRIYHREGQNELQEIQVENAKVILAASTFGQGASSRYEIIERSLNLCDFLLFSEKSLNYLQEVRLEPKEMYQKKFHP